ncbi:hypothetical protein GCM10007079_02310 [Nocardiopsis terrae]|uniref:Immunity protein 49 n=1 Tax=Nocardiopsis terrae TaxID=372655 RepID=A0ABR9HMQ3_9ACTN|nr:immunity 49 family protein [Nocardiopsis terrae]MBE1460283.1 hypothetical protein [Nocardiopsis terrae]GHC70640.1 hypothetical protein GCM10007079_02310 [Nocardiopsis terrae]
MVFVPRRSPVRVSVDRARIEEIEAERPRYAALLEERTATAGACLDEVYRPVLETLAAAPDCDWLWGWESWVLATQYHHAVVALGTAPRGTEFEWRVEHGDRRLTSPGPMAAADASAWTRAFFLALVGRDEKRVRDLASIPVERLREAGGAAHPAYLHHWVGALQALVNGDDRIVPHLRSAMELSDPRQPGADLPALELDLLVFPQLDLLRAFLGGEPEEFERILVRGLESFGEYHARSAGRGDPLAEVLPLGLLGLAGLAFDRVDHDPGYRMDVRSDYLPRALLERSWQGEFPV